MADNPIKLVNENGVIKGIDPETGNEVPVEFGDLTATSVGTDRSRTKEEPIYNVKHWGATGDGTTDDQSAIQNAVDAVTDGGTVFFPPGTYVMGDRLTVSNDDVKLLADPWAATLDFSDLDDTSYVRIDGQDRITVDGVKILGDTSASSKTSGVHIVDQADHCRIVHCWVEDCDDGIVALKNATGTRILHNVVINAGDDGINPGGGSTGAGGNGTRRTVVSGNYVEGSTNANIHVSTESEKTVVSGNTLIGGTHGINNGGTPGAVIISNNTIENPSDRGIDFLGFEEAFISGNYISDAARAINLNDSEAVILGNIAESISDWGFVASSNANNCLMGFNILRGSVSSYGVLLSGDDCTAIGNIIANGIRLVGASPRAGWNQAWYSNTGDLDKVNELGLEAAGAGNSPTTSNWQPGDVVENTDDNVVYILLSDGSTWTQIS